MKRGAFLGVATALFAVACGDDDAAADASAAVQDAGGDRDAGQVVWRPDAGSSSWNQDSGSASPPRFDAGLAGRSCAEARDPLPDFPLPRCAASTRDCMEGCPGSAEPEACRDACLAADQTPADSNTGLQCSGCIYLQLFTCIDRAGCHDGVAETFCCFEDRCGPGSAEGCNEQLCGIELNAAVTCGYFADTSCTDFSHDLIAACYADADDADAGL